MTRKPRKRKARMGPEFTIMRTKRWERLGRKR